MMRNPELNFTVYESALEAGKAFYRAAVRQFGPDRATYMQYQPKEFNEETKRFYDVKVAMDADWSRELNSQSTGPYHDC